ncbi:1,4-dihydroxy-2-naphthoate polyprenyltransferase [Bacteroides sp. 214]|uniref:1,4-dihydroxy-2-naphthoate polyprenyltransferase n=1 Tax=Bacteroides sp. 214 TaxID=2302935 RepID=UPI0013D8CE43|nr:1,4-dihydroxy-2-naphthoate polyprenyltransferase [Bacteroides sp. 214]NDW11750.1 1,4-dihydroxy-2-naphthoate polyprenyltransferase [Bacteroides sp. 214]
MNPITINSPKAWLLAARPKTLTGALIPVMVGSALAFSDGLFNWFPALVCALFACLMQIAANFINDLFDFLKGADRSDRLGPERACAQGWITANAMKTGIFLTVSLACALGCTLLFYGGWELIIVGVVCVVFAFLYTAGPYPLSYNGWGDVLVLLFFGFIPVGGTYHVQALTITPQVLVASLICGITIDTLLVVNNYRDREADKESGKRTIIVRLGEPFGRYLYLALGLAAAGCCLLFLIWGYHYAAWLPQLYIIPHILTWQKMSKIRSGKKLNSILGETSRNMLLIGLLLTIGLALN